MSNLVVHCSFAYRSGFRLRADFEAGPGATAVVGPSGGGKSTLVALIAGLLSPTEGTIRFAGRVLADAAGTSLPVHRRGIGVAFQEGRLFPHLSVRLNLLYGRRRFRMTNRSSVDAVIEALELGSLLSRSPRSLSGGQRQRVALGRALLTGAELLLLDEPVSALDVPLRDRVLDFVRETVAANRQTCLVVTHDTATAKRLSPVGTIPVSNGRAANGRAAEVVPEI